MGRPVALMVVAGGSLVLAACGSPHASEPDEAGAEPPADVVPDDYTGPFLGTNLTVLSSPDHGPQLCSYIMQSDPPQC